MSLSMPESQISPLPSYSVWCPLGPLLSPTPPHQTFFSILTVAISEIFNRGGCLSHKPSILPPDALFCGTFLSISKTVYIYKCVYIHIHTISGIRKAHKKKSQKISESPLDGWVSLGHPACVPAEMPFSVNFSKANNRKPLAHPAGFSRIFLISVQSALF